ncbi:hypothetical protein [Devosia sp.]|uniref:hypothetical protein n=1 Tax=Devosia sp. TaxID=1871048 RepID=UPI001AC91E69|nr:hypothetical protein [Devosia sp.]MBN9309001.1 hypothetical protein [Devosia sp.]
MGIEIKINASARARQLKREHPYMSNPDIAAMTGMRLANVTAALGRGEALQRPKSRAEARGRPYARRVTGD